MCRLYLQYCTLTNKALGTTCPNLRRGDKVLNFVPSDCLSGLLQPLDLSSRSIACSCGFHLIFWYTSNTYYHQHLCDKVLWPLQLEWLLVLVSVWRHIYKCVKCFIFWSHKCCGIQVGWLGPKSHRLDDYSFPPMLVRNRCLIEHFCRVGQVSPLVCRGPCPPWCSIFATVTVQILHLCYFKLSSFIFYDCLRSLPWHLQIDTGILFDNMKFPSYECYMTFWSLVLNHPPIRL